MWIRQVFVDRFGPLERRALRLPAKGLTTIEGPNEAGKSSLLELLRVLLFGPARGMMPKERGWGGRAELVSEDGHALWVERSYQGTSIRDDRGQGLDAAALDTMLAGTTRGLYHNVYAFGLTELQEIGSLKGDQVGAQLLSAGLGAGLNLQQLLASLKKARDEIYLPRGQKPALNQAHRAYREATEAVNRAERAEATWHRLKQDERRAGEAAERLAAADRELAGEQERLDRLTALWPDWVQWQQHMAAVVGDPDVAGWPPDAEERARDAAHALNAARQAVEAAEVRLADVLRALPEPPVVAALQDPAWQALVDRWPAVQRRQEEAERASEAQGQARQQLAVLAKQVGVDPTDDWPARALQLSDGVDAFGSAVEVAEGARREAEQRLTAADEAWRRTLIAAEHARATRTQELTRVPLLAVAAAVLALVAAFLPPPWSWGAGILAAGAGGMAAWRVMSAGADVPVPDDDGVDAPQLARARAERDAAVRAAEQAQRAWTRFWQDANLPSLTVHGARALLAQAPRWAALTAEVEERQRVMAASGAAAEQFWAEAAPVLARSHLQGGRSPETWQTWREHRHGWDELLRQEAWARGELQQAVERRAAAHDALATIWQSVEARSAEEFVGRMQRWAAWQDARREVVRLEHRLGADAVVQALGPDWRSVFQAWTAERLADEHTRVVGARQGLSEERDRAMGQLATARQARQALERSGTLAEARLQQEVCRQEVVRGALAWLELSWTESAVHVARDALRHERQPQVIRDTERLFSRMTAGRYGALWPTDDENLEVQAADGAVVYRAEALSRGAREQLYLAFRLAWIEEQARRGRSMPLVLDDILVNADPMRQRVMVDVLREFAERHQVLFLTCHPDQVALLEQAGAATRVALDAVS